jgi:hypothetical protein
MGRPAAAAPTLHCTMNIWVFLPVMESCLATAANRSAYHGGALLLVSSRAFRHEAKEENQENEAHHQKCATVAHVPSLPYLRQPEQTRQFRTA